MFRSKIRNSTLSWAACIFCHTNWPLLFYYKWDTWTARMALEEAPDADTPNNCFAKHILSVSKGALWKETCREILDFSFSMSLKNILNYQYQLKWKNKSQMWTQSADWAQYALLLGRRNAFQKLWTQVTVPRRISQLHRNHTQRTR